MLLLCGHGAALAQDPLVVYSGRSEALVGSLLERFETSSGIELDVRYGDTPALAAQLATEGAESPADLFYAQEAGYLAALGSQGHLLALPATLLESVPSEHRDPEGHWVGVSGRARVLVVSPERVPGDQRPRSLADLTAERFEGRVGWAPTNASFQAHVSVLRHLWGEERTREWLSAMKANGVRAYPKNSPQVEAVAAGDLDVGWVNHYYLHRLAHDGFAAENMSFPAEGEAGNVLIVSGIGIRTGSPRAEQALALARFLVGEETQRHLATAGFEYPLRPGIATHPDVPALDTIPFATIDQQWLVDLGPTLAMLESLGLL